MLPGTSPQVCEGRWDVVGKRLHQLPIFDAFLEGLYESVIGTTLYLHDGLIKAIEVFFQWFILALFDSEQVRDLHLPGIHAHEHYCKGVC